MKSWYQPPSFITYLLAPLAGVYRIFAQAKALAYRNQLLAAKRFSVPVIVVGNLTVGGAGKTPLVIALAKSLQQRGYRPGIVSRGYGSKSNIFPLLINENSSVLEAGDEPLLIAKHTKMPVVIDPNRPRAVEYLLANDDVNVVLTDDGLQHYRLARDVELVVVDGDRRFGNQFCLPAGPLREPMSRLQQVDFVIINGAARLGEERMQLLTNGFARVANMAVDIPLAPQRVHAVAGIGNPQRFFASLRQQGFEVIAHPFPDHHWFSEQELAFADDLPVIMTEKDAVKCQGFANQNLFVSKINATISDTFVMNLINLIK